jgi:hypothetical protein
LYQFWWSQSKKCALSDWVDVFPSADQIYDFLLSNFLILFSQSACCFDANGFLEDTIKHSFILHSMSMRPKMGCGSNLGIMVIIKVLQQYR